MSFGVQLALSGKSFQAEAHESILDAAIRAGVPLNYGCSNGNCGLCKARIVSGQTRQLGLHDFVIREAEKIQGYALMCSTACQGDVVIDAEVAACPEDIPAQNLRVKVRKIDRIGDGLAIITTQVPRTVRLRFMAGQYMHVSHEQGSHDYAIASCPCDEKRLEFHVRRQEDDPFSSLVFKGMGVGTRLNIRGPYGNFVIDETRGDPLVMIAFDTGFAAAKSLLEHVTAQDNERAVYLYWLACGTDGLYLDNLCRSWADALDQLEYFPILLPHGASDIPGSQNEGLAMIEEKLHQSLRHVGNLGNAEVYTVVPDPVARLVEQLLVQKGIARRQFHHEVLRGNPDLRCIRERSKT
ncbi:MAG: 2Fe-2S iron-sulfur cluster-binding protein [Gammaproteobacteria bacterium]|nr:2Fe-2S iron-sulfur cluster-binding protein [Gammaproteobacteria bacterium]